jgi:hypothetical protein
VEQKEVRGLPKSKTFEKQHLPQKTLWHPYGLQSLTPEKFIKVVNLILKGEHILLRFKRGERPEEATPPVITEDKLPEKVS